MSVLDDFKKLFEKDKQVTTVKQPTKLPVKTSLDDLRNNQLFNPTFNKSVKTPVQSIKTSTPIIKTPVLTTDPLTKRIENIKQTMPIVKPDPVIPNIVREVGSALKGVANQITAFVPETSTNITRSLAGTYKRFDPNNEIVNRIYQNTYKKPQYLKPVEDLNKALQPTKEETSSALSPYNIGKGVTRLATDLATSLVTGGTAPALIHGSETQNQNIDRALAADRSYNEAYDNATASAAVQAALEKIGISKLAKPFGSNPITKAVSGFVTEGSQEAIQQIADNLFASQYDKNQKILDKNVLESGIAGGIMGAPMSAAMPSTVTAVPTTKVEVARQIDSLPKGSAERQNAIQQMIQTTKQKAIDTAQSIKNTIPTGTQAQAGSLNIGRIAEDLGFIQKETPAPQVTKPKIIPDSVVKQDITESIDTGGLKVVDRARTIEDSMAHYNKHRPEMESAKTVDELIKAYKASYDDSNMGLYDGSSLEQLYYQKLKTLEGRDFRSSVKPQPIEQPKVVAPQVTKTEPKYLYHGTNDTILDNILKEGLKPGRRGQLSLSKDETYARSYAHDGMTPTGKTNAIILRVKADALDGKTTTKRLDGKSRPAPDQLNELLTSETIPPSSLEIYKNGKWQPLESAPQVTNTPEAKSATHQEILTNLDKSKPTDTLTTAELRQIGLTDAEFNRSREIAKKAVDDIYKANSRVEAERIHDAAQAKLGETVGDVGYLRKGVADAEVLRKQELVDSGIEPSLVNPTGKSTPQVTKTDPNRNWKLGNQVDEGNRIFSDAKRAVSKKMDEFRAINNGKPFTDAQKKELNVYIDQMDKGLNLTKNANAELSAPQVTKTPVKTKELKTAVDSIIQEKYPRLAYESMASESIFPNGIPKIKPSSIKETTGLSALEAGIPPRYLSESNGTTLDKVALDIEYRTDGGELTLGADDALDAIKSELDNKKSIREVTKKLAELRRDPAILAEAQALLQKEKSLYGTPDEAYIPTEKDYADFRKLLEGENKFKPLSQPIGNITPVAKQVYGAKIATDKTKKPVNQISTPVNNIPELVQQITKTKPETVAEVKRAVQGGTTEYGLLKSLQESDAPQELKDSIGAFGLSRTVKSNKQLWSDAQKRVFDDPADAMKYFNENNNDEAVATGYALINRYMKSGNTKEAGDIAMNMAERALESGRQVQAYAMMKKLTPEGAIEYVAKKVNKFIDQNPKKADKLNWNEETQNKLYSIAEEIRDLPEGHDRSLKIGEMQQLIDNIFPSSIADKAITVWKAGLLTSLRTHERNILSNTINVAGEQIATAPGSLADRLMSLRTGKRTLVASTGEGLSKGAKYGGQIAKDQIKTGIDVTDSNLKNNINHITWGDNKVEKALKAYTETVFRPLGAEDKIFKEAARSNSLYNQALAMAKNKNLKGKVHDDFVNKLVKDPTAEMRELADEDASRATFTQESALGTIIKNAKSAIKRSNSPGAKAASVVMDVLLPFTQVPSGVAAQLYSYSPIKMAKSMYDIGKVMITGDSTLQRKAAQGFGRSALGTSIIGAGAYLASQGLLLGQPEDDKEKAQWEAEGKQPNSIKIGDSWYQIGSIGPQMILALAGAQASKDAENGENPLTNMAGNLAKNFKDQTFLKGMSSALDAIDDPQRYSKYYLESQVTSLIPNIIKDLSKAVDPNAREALGLTDRIKQAIPFLSQELPKQYTSYGEEIKNNGIFQLIDMFNAKKEKDIKEVDYINALTNSVGTKEHIPTAADKTITINSETKKLTSQELSDYQKYIGEKSKNIINGLMNNESFNSMTDEEKANNIDSALKDINAAAKVELFGNDPSQPTKGTKAILAGKDPINKYTNAGNLALPDNLSKSAVTILSDYDVMDDAEKETWKSAQNEDPKVAESLKAWSNGANLPPVTNEIAKQWAEYEKSRLDGTLSKLAQNDNKKSILKDLLNTQLNVDEKEISGLSKDEITNYMDNGMISDTNLANALAVESQMYDMGLITKETLAKKVGVSARGYKSSGGKSQSISSILASIKNQNTMSTSGYSDLARLLSGTTFKSTPKKAVLKEIKVKE